MTPALMPLSNKAPAPSDLTALRAACGWGDIPLPTATAALEASVLHVTAFEDTTLIAMGRVVGDGALYFYLQDIVVHPDHRGQGYGRAIVDRLLADLVPMAKPGATIGLMAAKGVEGLYGDAGFTARPIQTLGAGMTLFP
jgi:GNAT superfamily N-acetyltransferase